MLRHLTLPRTVGSAGFSRIEPTFGSPLPLFTTSHPHFCDVRCGHGHVTTGSHAIFHPSRPEFVGPTRHIPSVSAACAWLLVLQRSCLFLMYAAANTNPSLHLRAARAIVWQHPPSFATVEGVEPTSLCHAVSIADRRRDGALRCGKSLLVGPSITLVVIDPWCMLKNGERSGFNMSASVLLRACKSCSHVQFAGSPLYAGAR
jgi:hypothetical protein